MKNVLIDDEYHRNAKIAAAKLSLSLSKFVELCIANETCKYCPPDIDVKKPAAAKKEKSK